VQDYHSIWIYEGQLYIEYRQIHLAQYAYRYDRPAKRLTEVSHPRRYDTAFRSPQLEILELDDEQWLKVRPRPYQPYPKRTLPDVTQLALPQLATWIVLLGRLFFPNV
jgi:hypothetical protein